jgi:flagellar motor component MotA
MKALYRARLAKARNNQKEAVRNYISLLGNSSDTTRKTGILELENLLLEMGSADRNLLESLTAETKKFRSDADFYGSSMIRIARIYPYLKDVYKAKEILESVMNGNFSKEVKAEAEKAYEELKKDFLEYR